MTATLVLLRDTFRHLRWADERVLRSLHALAPPPPRAVEQFAHILGADAVWLARAEQRSSDVPVWPAADVQWCERSAARIHLGWERLFDTLDEPGLDRTVKYKNSAGDEYETALRDILLHVALHASYHRGQIAALVRSAGGEPSPTDYISFVRGADAARRQP